MKLDETKRQKIIHPIPPLYDKDSKILILGSFPSVKSREEAFFYGHKQNRFWKVLAALFQEASGGNSFGEKTGNCRGKEGFPSQKLYCGVGCDS